MITYCRMEAKLIHGQTTTVLRSRYKCDGIIVVDDAIAADSAMKSVFAAAAPAGIKVYFFTTLKGKEQLVKARDSAYNYFVILRDPIAAKKLLDAGYTFDYPVVCGQQFNRENTLSVMQGIGLTEAEIDALEYLSANGVELLFDPSCTNENLPWEQVKILIDKARKK